MLGFSLAFLIGFTLGILGGGGSILTVPILVYALGMEAKVSIAMSLAIVGLTSLVGVINHFRAKNVALKVAGMFAPFAMIGTFLGAKLSQFLSGNTQLILFALVMMAASFFMIKGRSESEGDEKEIKLPILALQGVLVGIVTGIVGVGGGFLIVPALVLLGGLSMRKAVGTSLLIISLNSFSGFTGYLGLVAIDWPFLLKFSLFSIGGILVGSQLVPYIPQRVLKKGFGVFLIFMGIFVLIKNL